ADRYLHNASLSADGGALAVTTRGKAYSMHNWEGAVTQHGEPDGVRYRLLHYLNDGKRMVAAASDEGPGERLVLLDQKGQREIPVDLGRIVNLEPAPVGGRVALSNHRNEVWVVDLDRKKIKPTLVDKSPYDRIAGLGWSPDGNWLAYGYPQTAQTTCIKLWDGKSSHVATQPVLHDMRPAFDPDGKYLYFIGQRDFNPVYDAVQFDLGFPRASRPFLIPLRRDLASPFIPQPKTPEPPADDKKKKKKSGPELTRIDLDGIADRVVGFPLSEARYGRVLGVKGGKVLWSVFPLEGGRVSFWDTAPPAKGTIEQYDFEKNKQEPFVEGISDFTVARDGKTLLYRAGRRLRVVKATEKPEKSKDGDEGTKFSRLTGWVDLGRIRVSVRPAAEWRQMFREAWRLQREHFWVEDMYGIDWDEVYARYRPLVDRIATRHEFSDLLWELQGELGTSHAYEMGGEYRQSPHYRQGSLGVEFERDKKSGLFRIARILQGDPWDPPVTSPFNTPGANVAVGEVVLAINGLPVGGDVQPAERLVNQAGLEVAVTLRGKGGATRTVTVKALADERAARYREWVDLQRRIVHEKTGGRVGYVHIPDMGPEGYSQFHRGFLVEYDRDALIVDVRHNGGGHVSSLLLQKLARRRLGYDFPRWGMPVPYPMESPGGPLVALTNEHAGSDGDMFSHAFKMLKLGPLIGKRTWGGVVGISPRHTLADGTITTQPEFSFWFDDVGWRLENYGTEPDVEVDNAPQDYRRGKDPQLERAIAVALDLLKERPPHRPERMPHNRFVRPRLGPRPQGQPAKKRKR
ncbi:MAG: peptidase, partial [Armatimonadetes bacterium]|nr:peptidase [Armatimonadota bacterium]